MDKLEKPFYHRYQNFVKNFKVVSLKPHGSNEYYIVHLEFHD